MILIDYTVHEHICAQYSIKSCCTTYSGFGGKRRFEIINIFFFCKKAFDFLLCGPRVFQAASEVDMEEVKYADDDWMRGRYIIMGKLGEGGFGKVRKAIHAATNDTVAIKEMNKKKLGVSEVPFDIVVTFAGRHCSHPQGSGGHEELDAPEHLPASAVRRDEDRLLPSLGGTFCLAI